MSAPKHTPGPWKADGQSVVSDAGRIIHDRSGIRFVHSMALGVLFSTHTGSEEEAQANARLIAAAPELLEALKWYEDKVSGIHGNDDAEALEADRGAKARAAIAKAEGAS